MSSDNDNRPDPMRGYAIRYQKIPAAAVRPSPPITPAEQAGCVEAQWLAFELTTKSPRKR